MQAWVCHSPLPLYGFEIFPNNEKLKVFGVDIYHCRPSMLSISCYLYHRVAIKVKRRILHESFMYSVPYHLHLLRVSVRLCSNSPEGFPSLLLTGSPLRLHLRYF